MDVTTKTEGRRIIEVGGVEFYVEDLVNPLSWLRHGEVKETLVDKSTLRRMEEAGLVRKQMGGLMSDTSGEPDKWEQVDGKCRELFEQLNEPYHRLRPKVAGVSGFGMWDESEDDRARQKADHAKARLERRNPDVEFFVDEEELSSIKVR